MTTTTRSSDQSMLQYRKVRRKTACQACRRLRLKSRAGPNQLEALTCEVGYHHKSCLRELRLVIVPTGVRPRKSNRQLRMNFRIARERAREPERFATLVTRDTGLVQKLWYNYLKLTFDIEPKSIWKRNWATLSRVPDRGLARGLVRAKALTLMRVFNTLT